MPVVPQEHMRHLMPVKEARHQLGGISPTTFYALVKEGELSLAKIGRRSFVQAEELDQHVLQAVSNVILEVSACRNNVSDQAEAIASKLGDRVQSG